MSDLRDRFTSIRRRLGPCLPLVVAILLLAAKANAASEKVIYSFTGGSHGAQPNCALTWGIDGNLYGTTKLGGNLTACKSGCGTVFQLKYTGTGWQETVIFTFNGKDGAVPNSGVIFRGAESLYGTTAFGGPDNNGVIFKLTENQNHTWSETVIHAFRGLDDGNTPFGTPLFDDAGSLYGTTRFGPGKHEAGDGIVFELIPAGKSWSEKILYEFKDSPDGADPYAGLISDGKGTYYGTTFNGGIRSKKCLASTCGIVYSLTQSKTGKWEKQTIYRFCSKPDCTDPGNPKDGVIFDDAGNLYGGTSENPGGDGSVYELSPNRDGTWSQKVLYAFHGQDGNDVDGGLLFDHAGDLFGATDVGGSFTVCTDGDGVAHYHHLGCGTIFRLSPDKSGNWTESVLHDLGGFGDGSHPRRVMVEGKIGKLYGVTNLGGEYGQGIVFEVTP